NNGTIYKINTDGTGYTVLKHFSGSDGATPFFAGLTLSGSVLYGATYYGGSANYGTVFRLNTDGSGYTVLKSFTGGVGDGRYPNTMLTLANGVLYGTTEQGGGSSDAGTVFKLNTNGTGYTVLHNFTNSPDGAAPYAGVTLSGNMLYGTTRNGGNSDSGTLFQVNTDGTGYAVLKHFAYSDGAYPHGLALSHGA